MSLLRRRMLMARKPESGGEVTFPAVLVPHLDFESENLSNYNIAKYFLEHYTNMNTGPFSNYTPITETVTISGSSFCDGIVLGITKQESSDYAVVCFFTQEGINNFYIFRVFIMDGNISKGYTHEFFMIK